MGCFLTTLNHFENLTNARNYACSVVVRKQQIAATGKVKVLLKLVTELRLYKVVKCIKLPSKRLQHVLNKSNHYSNFKPL